MRYHHELSLDERVQICTYHERGYGVRLIAGLLHRSPSTISRELRRATGSAQDYTVQAAQDRAHLLRHKARVRRKLLNGEHWSEVSKRLLSGWSPRQVSKSISREGIAVSHETIYKAVYLTPRGELRKDLIGCLRQSRAKRRPCGQGRDRRNQLCNMQSIHIRPPEVDERLIPGHWEGDLIKGPSNRSSIGTLVERCSGFLVLARMLSASANDALEGFGTALEGIPPGLRKTLTYDQGREMAYHEALSVRTGVKVYFADPHSPWQRGSNENTNGLLRQYLPKGTNLAEYSQDDLNTIAYSLNTRPRCRLNWRTPLQVYMEFIALDQVATGTLQ